MRRELGMMLIEIMVVIAIIGLVMAGVGVAAWHAWIRAQNREAADEIHSIEQGIHMWAVDHKSRVCPESLDELRAKRYITKAPKDPWGESYLYVCPVANELGFEITSKGRDRQAGTAD